ncbi:MAG: hypothetical protein ACSHW0_08375 [Thalassotalea sp.]
MLRFIFALALSISNIHILKARDVLWDTDPKIYSFIVMHHTEIKRQVNLDNFSLIAEIKSQLECAKQEIAKDQVILISNQQLTPAIFAIKLVDVLSC